MTCKRGRLRYGKDGDTWFCYTTTPEASFGFDGYSKESLSGAVIQCASKMASAIVRIRRATNQVPTRDRSKRKEPT